MLHHPAGQFLDRKSCDDRPGGRVGRRDVCSEARDIAETLSAMPMPMAARWWSAWRTTAGASSSVV
ncbi:MAG TPA: hypothetical protein DEP84_36560 [Chloroflexi bacterium]|nr:hypothetical protein [Chloroflexota bacterium]